MPRWLAAVVAALMIGLLVVLWRSDTRLAAMTATDIEVASWVNQERRWNHLTPVVLDPDLAAQAQLQADRLAECRCLVHSPRGELGWWLNRGWRALGETVGGTSGQGSDGLFAVHKAFIASPGHRAILLDEQYDGLGTAVRRSSDGQQWIVHLLGAT